MPAPQAGWYTERSQYIGMALLFIRTPFVWNSLHLRIRETQSLPGFKRHILRLTFSSQLTPPPSDPPSNAPRFFNRLRRYISFVLTYLDTSCLFYQSGKVETHQQSCSMFSQVTGDSLWASKSSHYRTSHQAQLSLAILPRVDSVSIGDSYGHHSGSKQQILHSN